MKRLILASNSPRRKELLKELGYEFDVIPSNIDETIDDSKPIKEEIEKLSYNKALSIFNDNKDSIVIGSDTVVVKNNKVFGKPKDKEEIEKLSYNKALSIFNDNKDSIVIGSDTVVVKNNKVFGKPKDKEEAKKMIDELNDGDHQVITAVSIISNKISETFSTIATVTFGNMSDEEISEYINNNDILDKAGAYAIQGEAKKYIKSINGDYYTIVGLPIYELKKRLKKYYENN